MKSAITMVTTTIGFCVAVTVASSAHSQIFPSSPSATPVELVTVGGTVELVRESGLDSCDHCQMCEEDCRATHLVVRSRGERLEVHLAPAWFLERLEFTPAVDDVVRITGARALTKERTVVAHEVHIGRTVIKLRDEHGRPLWRRLLTEATDGICDRVGRSS